MAVTELKLSLQIPAKLSFLITRKKRLKVTYGGRGAAKSRSIGQALLQKGTERKLLILCTRELQKSIKDSVHRILKNEIERMGLQGFYTVLDSKIVGINGTEFIFEGLRNNPDAIKSTEGIDIVWCEEADNITEVSWEVLTPTIRNSKSEIWISFNPKYETDFLYTEYVLPYFDELELRGCVETEEAIIQKVNYWDNPWFPDVLKTEMERTRRKNFKKYLHVWEGYCKLDYKDAIIQPEWVEAAIDAHKKLGFEPRGERVTSFDPADEGEDKKAVGHRYGVVVQEAKHWSEGNITTAIDVAFEMADESRSDFLVYDNIGVGTGMKVALDLKSAQRFKAVGFGGADGVDYPKLEYKEDRKNKDTFKNKRAQYYWYLRDRFYSTYLAVAEGKYIDPDELISLSSDIEHLKFLKLELCSIKRKRGGPARVIQIESKEDMKKDDRKSPNLADMLMMMFANPDIEIDEDNETYEIPVAQGVW